LIKLARKRGSEKGKFEIIAMNDSFHGRTLATLAATGRSKYRKGFQPDMAGFKFVDFNDLEAARAAVDEKTAAILVEPVQGEGGIIPADVEYLKGLRALCDEKDILLLCDEVQCGMGRLGTRFAYQQFGVEPDIISLAKAIANGFPMGAIIAGKKCADVFEVGNHASTFGGTPLACAAALAVQDAFDKDGVLENCTKEGDFLRSELSKIAEKYSFVKCVRGMGLMIGVVLDRPAGPVASILLKDNMVALTAGETVLRLVPPLTITRDDSKLAIEKIDRALAEFARQESIC
jgi:acetylornithine/succinyldiaminopimelate/putrescine aminotransferase